MTDIEEVHHIKREFAKGKTVIYCDFENIMYQDV